MATLLSSLQTTLKGYAFYRGREGHWSFVVHRITGLGTLLFLIIHILDTSSVYFFPELYDHAIALYQSTFFMLQEIILVFCVIFHGVNGLRLAYYDMWKPAGWNIPGQRRSVKMTFIASVILWLPAAGWMGYKMLHHNYGLF
jgi:succinate dehydrogenase / fumarate reductase, cytochrome b subunit